MYSISVRLCVFLGVLLCRGNRLLTGSNTRRLRLWGVAAVQGMRPGGEASNTEDRSVAHRTLLLSLHILLLTYLFPHPPMLHSVSSHHMSLKPIHLCGLLIYIP